MAQQRVDTRWLSSTGGAKRLAPATYVVRAGTRCLVLDVDVAGSKDTKYIAADEVGKWACDHDGPVSECGRCVDCGVPLL